MFGHPWSLPSAAASDSVTVRKVSMFQPLKLYLSSKSFTLFLGLIFVKRFCLRDAVLVYVVVTTQLHRCSVYLDVKAS